MRGFCPQRRPRAAEKKAPGPGERDQPEAHAGQAEQPRVLGFDAGEDATVEGEGERHHVAHAGRGDCHADEETVVFLATHLPGTDVFGRMGRIAQRVQRGGDARELDLLRVPADVDDRAAHVQPRFDHPRQDLRQFLHEPDAGCAVDAFEVELGGRRAVSQRAIIERAEDLVVEFRIGPLGGLHRPGVSGRGVADPIESFQAAAVDYRVNRAAAVAAELQVVARFDEPRRHGQAAVRAYFGWRNHYAIIPPRHVRPPAARPPDMLLAAGRHNPARALGVYVLIAAARTVGTRVVKRFGGLQQLVHVDLRPAEPAHAAV